MMYWVPNSLVLVRYNRFQHACRENEAPVLLAGGVGTLTSVNGKGRKDQFALCEAKSVPGATRRVGKPEMLEDLRTPFF